MHWSYRANGLSFTLLSALTAVLALGYAEVDVVWMIAVLVVAAVFVGVAGLLWRGVAWVAPAALGMMGYTAFAWGQSAIAAGVYAAADPWGATFIAYASLCGGCLLVMALLLFTPRTVSLRHAASLAFAGGAVVPSVTFALAPGQDPGIAGAMLGGVALLLTGTVALGREQSWGLFGNFFGAIVLAVGSAYAPRLGMLAGGHPWLPNGSALLLNVIGTSAAVMGLMSFAVYAGPVFRFLFGARAPSDSPD